MRERVLAAIAKKIEEQRSGEEKKAADEKSLEDLVARGMKASEQRQFLGDSTPLYEDYDKGIAVGGDPNKSAADILLNIRAQARAKGRGGSLRGGKPTPEDFAASTSPTGGGMTYVQDSPELRQREEDLKEWLAGGALRDAEYAMSPEMSRRDPAGANRAADVLTGLKQTKALEKEQMIRNKLVESIGGGSGKVPFEKAMQLEMAGINIPYAARGVSPEQFDAKLNDIVTGAGADLVRALEAQSMGAPAEAVGAVAAFSKYVQEKAKQIKSLVDSGQMTRDEAAEYLDKIIRSEAQSSNAIQAAQMLGFINQQQAPVAGE
jgi:hypothetical protein